MFFACNSVLFVGRRGSVTPQIFIIFSRYCRINSAHDGFCNLRSKKLNISWINGISISVSNGIQFYGRVQF